MGKDAVPKGYGSVEGSRELTEAVRCVTALEIGGREGEEMQRILGNGVGCSWGTSAWEDLCS